MQRVCDLNLCSVCSGKIPKSIFEPSCSSVVWRLCRSFPQTDEEFLRLVFNVPSHLMHEFVCEHNALFSTKIVKTPCISRQREKNHVCHLYDPFRVFFLWLRGKVSHDKVCPGNGDILGETFVHSFVLSFLAFREMGLDSLCRLLSSFLSFEACAFN